MQKLILVIVTALLLTFNSWADVNLDGTDDLINVSGYQGVTGTSAHSMMACFQTTSTAEMKVISWGDTTSPSGSQVQLTVTNGELFVRVGSGFASWDPAMGLARLYDGAHHCVVITIPASSTVNEYHLWADGVDYLEEDSGTRTMNIVSDANVRVGSDVSSGSNFDGNISEAHIWNVQLADAVALQLSARSLKRLPLQFNSPQMALMLDDVADGVSADGSTFLDYSGNGNNGTGDDGANNTGLLGVAGTLGY